MAKAYELQKGMFINYGNLTPIDPYYGNLPKPYRPILCQPKPSETHTLRLKPFSAKELSETAGAEKCRLPLAARHFVVKLGEWKLKWKLL